MRDEIDDLPKLPSGWIWTKLGEVASDPQYGWTTSAVADGELHLLRTTDITPGHVDWTSVPFCKDEPPDVAKYLLHDGDIVISRAGSVGYSHLVKDPPKSVFASYLIRFQPLINNQYFAMFLTSPSYWGSISDKSIGIALANVNASKLKQISMPLPPLPEQHRILAKIEELFTRLDTGVETLKKIKAQLKRYRQAVLKHAFEGKLTAEWRQAHKHELESASVLLDRIKQERHKTAKGKYKELPPLDTSDLSDLPDGWLWTLVEDVSILVTKGSTPTSYNFDYVPDGINFIKVENLKNGRLDRASISEFITKDTHDFLKRSQLMKDDILFSIAGTIGKVAIVHSDDLPANINQAIAVIRCPWEFINPCYLKLVLDSETARSSIERRPRGVGMNNVSLGDVKNIVFSLPPLPEQHRIVEEIERRFSVADEIEKTLGHSLKQAERLRQSILKRAFEGKLVPQDSNDEPAEKLLERIRQERARQQAERKPAKSSRNKSNTKQMRLV